MKEQICLAPFRPFPSTVAIDVEAAISSQRPFREAVPLSVAVVESSLHSFANEMSVNGLNGVLEGFCKNGNSSQREFVLKAFSGRGNQHVGAEGDGKFYMDGDHSLALGYLCRKRYPLWIGVVSFSLGSKDIQ